MTLEDSVKDFYSCLKFPGTYRLEDIEFYNEYLCNRYLQVYDDAVKNSKRVLDVGCGSGFIINLLAYRNPNVNFYAIDFCDSINYAIEFSRKHNISNITYYKENFLNFASDKKFDTVISNGVLHHIPEYKKAIENIKNLSSRDSKIVIGIYNKYGKIFKKFKKIKYTNYVLEQDQECVPYEQSFSDQEFKKLFPEYNIKSIMPSISNKLVDVVNLLNYKNGGLTLYTIQK